jgi:hypothetical protein
MGRAIFVLVVLLGGCTGVHHELAKTDKNDPVWQLNVGKWQAGTNDLTTAPASGS